MNKNTPEMPFVLLVFLFITSSSSIGPAKSNSAHLVSFSQLDIPKEADGSMLSCLAVSNTSACNRCINHRTNVSSGGVIFSNVTFPPPDGLSCFQTTLIPPACNHIPTEYATFPRSGSHAAHFMLSVATRYSYGTIFHLEQPKSFCSNIKQYDALLFVKTHRPLFEPRVTYPQLTRTILQTRNPVAAVASYWYYQKSRLSNRVNDFIRFSDYWAQRLATDRAKDTILTIRWEDIHVDAVGNVDKIARFLNVQIRQGWIECLLHKNNNNTRSAIFMPVEQKHIQAFRNYPDEYKRLITNNSTSWFIRKFNYSEIIDQATAVINYKNKTK